MLRRRFRTEHAISPFDHIQINLEDALLAPHGLDHQGDNRFLRLAPRRFGRRQKKIFGQLLRNCRTAGHHLAFFLVLLNRPLDALPVKAFVMNEEVILRDDERSFQVARYLSVVNPLLFQTRLRVFELQFGQTDFHETRAIGVNPLPPQDPAKQPQLIEEQQSNCAKKQAL